MLGLKYYRTLKNNSRSELWFKFKSSSFSSWGMKKKTGPAELSNNAPQTLRVPDIPVKLSNLRNGMKLVHEYKCSDVTTIGFFLPAGSMHEKCEERGASLFMEHLIFRQTECKSQFKIEQEIEEIGGLLGAIAMRDMFLFWGTVPSYDIQKLLILLADIINNGVIVSDEIIRERFTILRELQEIEKDGRRIVMNYLKNIAYQGTELSRSIYPESHVIKSLSAELVSGFRDRLFRPSLMTMVCSGGTSLNDIEKYANEHLICCDVLSSPTPDSCEMQAYILPQYRFSAIDMRWRNDDEKLAHVAIAVETSGFSDSADYYALTVAKQIIGSWDMTSDGSYHNAPNVARCAFNSNLCHVYKSFNISWANAGLWGCYFACDHMQLENILCLIQNGWLRLSTTITEKEVERAVNQCKTHELTKLNNSIDRFFDIAINLFRRGCYESIAERIYNYDKINVTDIRDVAMKYIYDRCPAVAAIGPVENLPDYARIRASMYSLRY